MAADLRRLTSPERLMPLFVLLVAMAVLGITGRQVYLARDLELARSQVTADDLARSLADHARSTLETADLLLAGLVERLETDGTSEAAIPRLHNFMVARVNATTRVHDLIALRADGAWLTSSLPRQPSYSNADREYFAHHRDNPDRGSHISPPILSRTGGRWTITVSRRFDRPDKSFGGVVVAKIDFDTFTRFYASFNIGPHGAITLVNQNGTLLVRLPTMLDMIGTNLSGSGIFQKYREFGPVGHSDARSQIDGVRRLASFREVDGYPLVLFVSFSRADVLANWRTSALTTLGMAAVVSLALGLVGWRLVAQMRLRQKAELGVRHSERQYRLLAEYSTDMIVQSGPDLRRVYVSPACHSLLGYTQYELIGGHPHDIIHPDDWPLIAGDISAATTNGAMPPISYRLRRKDGVYIWVELLGRKLADGMGYVAAVRDITRRKEAEAALHQAHNQLQRLVMLDGLTGIANRRCLDSMLDKETRRAARAGLPLALLLLDVDQFKAFNDTYGHPAGDGCLRDIARAMGQMMQRPADLAARYGGEEFAMLLPGTNHAGAMALAERVRHAVSELGIAHAATPAKVVTVSIGVAVVWPQRHEQAAARLVEMADKALYQAKSSGRDRVCAAAETVEPL